MSRTTMNPDDILDLASDELTYIPSNDQRRVKSAFWTRYQEVATSTPADLSLAVVTKFVTDRRLPKWWTISGFSQWFLNAQEFRDRLEYLSYKILDSLELILDDPKANANAKVSAAKLLLEAGRKMPSKAAEQGYLDESVSKMDRHQLEEFIKRKTRTLTSA